MKSAAAQDTQSPESWTLSAKMISGRWLGHTPIVFSPRPLYINVSINLRRIESKGHITDAWAPQSVHFAIHPVQESRMPQEPAPGSGLHRFQQGGLFCPEG